MADELDLEKVKTVIEFAVGETRPNLTLFLHVPAEVSAERLRSRQSTLPFVRDRIEEADRKFFERVAHGFGVIAAKRTAARQVRQWRAAGGSGLRKNLGTRPAGFAESRTMVNGLAEFEAMNTFEP